MPPNVRACIYVLLALMAGYYLCTLVFKNQLQDIKKITSGWVVITVMIFLVPSPSVYFLLLGLVLFGMAPKDNDKRFQFYCALLPAIPMNVAWRVSFLGIETVMWFNHIVILSISLLLPMFMQPKTIRRQHLHEATVLRSHKMFTIFFVYMLFTILLSCRGSNITSIARMLLENFLNPLILLLMANRLCRDRAVINHILFGILISGVFVALISSIEQLTKWKLYNEVSRNFIYWEHFSLNVRDIRWGLMRTPATMEPIPLGYFMGLCVVISLYFSGLRKRGDQLYAGSIMVTGILVLGLVFSGSRGAWFVTLLMIFLLIYFEKRFKPIRTIVIIIGIFLAFSASAVLTHLTQSDPYGTFQYRIDLFNNSLIAIKDNFLFGDVDFRSHPALQASKQGEGIIDVVNVYLGVALRHGMVALSLLMIVVVGVIRGLIKMRALEEAKEDAADFEWQIRVLLVMILGGVAMISTVSFVDRISHYLWLTVVFGICFLGVQSRPTPKN